MTKSDLRTGMIVTTREGKEYVFVKDFLVDDDYTMKSCEDGILVNGQIPSWTKMTHYDDKLKAGIGYESLDIMKVEIPNHPYAFANIPYNKKYRKLVWERKEPKKMTVSEIEAILGYKIEVVSEVK